MILLDLIKKQKSCAHLKVKPDNDLTYCQDCGELVENQWYMTRCACCGIKLKSIIKNEEIVPGQKFCHNCGTSIHVVERLSKINFIDINFAVLVKTAVPSYTKNITQSWVDPNVQQNPKLISAKS